MGHSKIAAGCACLLAETLPIYNQYTIDACALTDKGSAEVVLRSVGYLTCMSKSWRLVDASSQQLTVHVTGSNGVI